MKVDLPKLKIAVISYEFPPDTGGGGIGTYIKEMFEMLTEKGHYVELFCGTNKASYHNEIPNGRVNKVYETDTENFKHSVIAPFTLRNEIIKFDVIESAEYKADAIEIKKLYPHLPLKVTLHTSSALTNDANNAPLNLYAKTRFFLAGLLRLQWNTSVFTSYKLNKTFDPEYQIVVKADIVTSPADSLSILTKNKWNLSFNPRLVRYPYKPSLDLLNIETRTTSQDKINVYFVGRLEVRKGILPLFGAIPQILKVNKHIHFHFVGKTCPSPVANLTMQQYGENMLQQFKDNIHFKGYVDLKNIPKELNEADICIYPSIWDASPLVCLEAMAAGKAIIASYKGGMSELLDEASGVLINPQNIKEIVNAVLDLAKNHDKRLNFGKNARQRLLNNHSHEKILPQLIDSYKIAISLAKNRP